jgi:hypothetical protein
MYAYRKRPNDFKRRVIEFIVGNKLDILFAEQKWLDMIDDAELNTKYYNQKKFASGGSVKGRKQPKTEQDKLKLRKPRINKSNMSYPKSPSHKQSISDALKGRKGTNSMLGKSHTTESKRLISKSAKDRCKVCCIFCKEEVLVCHLGQYHRRAACGKLDKTKSRKPMPKHSAETRLSLSIEKMSFQLKTPMGLFLSYKDFEISTGIPAQSIKNVFIDLNRKPTRPKLKQFNLENEHRLTWAELGFERILINK